MTIEQQARALGWVQFRSGGLWFKGAHFAHSAANAVALTKSGYVT